MERNTYLVKRKAIGTVFLVSGFMFQVKFQVFEQLGTHDREKKRSGTI